MMQPPIHNTCFVPVSKPQQSGKRATGFNTSDGGGGCRVEWKHQRLTWTLDHKMCLLESMGTTVSLPSVGRLIGASKRKHRDTSVKDLSV